MKFSKGDHTVYHNSIGDEVPSATTILKILNKPALIKWANYLGFRGLNVDSVLTEYADRGTIVHELVSAYLNSALIVYVPDKKVKTSDVLELFKIFKKWCKNHDIAPILLEKSFCSNKFGGTVDFYGLIDGKYTLLDFKTSKEIRLSMFLQLAMYCILLEENGYTVDRAGILLINTKRKDERFITRQELQSYIEFVKSLIDIFHSYYRLINDTGWKEEII